VAVDDADVSRSEPLVLRFSFGAAGGLLTHRHGLRDDGLAAQQGLVDFPVSSILLPLAGNYLLTHSLDQVNFAIVFPPGAWPDGPATFKVSLTANGQTATSSVDVTRRRLIRPARRRGRRDVSARALALDRARALGDDPLAAVLVPPALPVGLGASGVRAGELLERLAQRLALLQVAAPPPPEAPITATSRLTPS
jgi:hypothetical protein